MYFERALREFVLYKLFYGFNIIIYKRLLINLALHEKVVLGLFHAFFCQESINYIDKLKYIY